jgi:hypothetical protein
MKLHDLLEQSNLAALGLLDADDHAAFEKALASAPESIRRQVIADQAKWSQGGALLPNVEPPSTLRDRVLDSVHAAIVESAISEHAGEYDQHVASRRVPGYWRAVSLGLVTALAVMTGAFVYVYQNNVATERLRGDNQALTDLVSTFGPQFTDMLFDPTTRHTILRSEDGVSEQRAMAAVFTNSDWNKSRLFTANLAREEGRTYRLVALDSAGHVVKELASFEGGGQTQTYEFETINPGTRLALVSEVIGLPATSERLLLSAVV